MCGPLKVHVNIKEWCHKFQLNKPLHIVNAVEKGPPYSPQKYRSKLNDCTVLIFSEMPPSPLSPSPRPQGTQPHYQLGDLGLIPRPAQNIPSSVEKMKESATASRLGGLKKVLTKSVATQTISAPKVSLTSCRSNSSNL